MIARHFLRDDMTAASGNEPAWTVGEERTYKGMIKLCETGYHSSPSWYDALGYANGSMACIVDVSKPVQSDATKSVSKTRTLIAARNVAHELRLWAADCAERALQRESDGGREPDARSWSAIEVARRFAAGEATAAELASASSSASSAAYAAYASAFAASSASASSVASASSAAVAYAVASSVASASSAAYAAAYAVGARAAEKQWQAAVLNARLDALFPVVTL